MTGRPTQTEPLVRCLMCATLAWGVLAVGVAFLSEIKPVIGATVSKSGVRPQVISVPSGPGAIEGLGESFEPQLNHGSGQYALPLAAPPGRAGFAPDTE